MGCCCCLCLCTLGCCHDTCHSLAGRVLPCAAKSQPPQLTAVIPCSSTACLCSSLHNACNLLVHCCVTGGRELVQHCQALAKLLFVLLCAGTCAWSRPLGLLEEVGSHTGSQHLQWWRRWRPIQLQGLLLLAPCCLTVRTTQGPILLQVGPPAPTDGSQDSLCSIGVCITLLPVQLVVFYCML